MSVFFFRFWVLNCLEFRLPFHSIGSRRVAGTESYLQPVREAVNDRGLFTAGWFGEREKHCSRLEIYDRLRASEQAAS